MSNVQCFRIVRGTEFHKAIQKYLELAPRWAGVTHELGNSIGEEITRIARMPQALRIDYTELKLEENKKIFKKDGMLRKNLKVSKEIHEKYIEIIKSLGLEEYEEISTINFVHGAMRRKDQKLESFIANEDDVFYKGDFDLAKKTDGLVEPITLIEYQETYLAELKKREANQ
ncbi:hypothetical protein MM326_15065 [Alkalihalobacillus sp. LMS6]|uniref:hypothetical protein n=1 Tax=Alkalihalobacillus sp. LMS6 TaxID=2924034 RepID=UPI0020D07367|nr:hypothetical protein [Alkalihalobacillus sp. LMS6]UTR05417.1 hypothetical protein MM326_15065 [Alkalihalobacillus sp. LMS6]